MLKELVEAYPGFIVAGGGTGTNPVRAKFGLALGESGSESAASKYVVHLESLAARLGKLFPKQFFDAKHTLIADIAWMKEQLAQLKSQAGRK